MATMFTAPGYKQFDAFCAECQEPDDDAHPVIADAHVISDEESMDELINGPAIDDHYPIIDDSDADIPAQTFVTGQREEHDFTLDGPGVDAPTVIPDEEDSYASTSAEFLRIHHCLGHVSPTKIQVMAKQGLLPVRLATCDVPMCTACLYGKATRRPWRGKVPQNKEKSTPVITRPGDCVSVDQLESATPGFIGEMKGKLTTKRYRAATVFYDQYSGLSYTHLQKSTTGDETVEAKEAFEAFAKRHGVTIRHYHADNGRFADNKFRQSVKEKRQTLSFCGVNAHHMNGCAERQIRELQDQARTMLIHVKRRWPTAISAHLWAYALRSANEVYNATPRLKD